MSPEILRDQMGALLRVAFPDPRVQIGEALITSALSMMPENVQESAVGEAAGLLLGQEIPKVEHEFVLGYYLAKAHHIRRGVHSFVGHVPMVRVVLPDVREDISTKIGIVYAGDHRLYRRAMVADHYASLLDFEPTRVELTTPARFLGARFAAVATYTLFHGDSIGAWVLEAGMATGEPMVLFISPDGDKITRRAWYEPTPFSKDSNFYKGSVTFNGDNSLSVMSLSVHETREAESHMDVTVHFEPVENPEPCFASKLTFEAACRVATIAQKLNRPVPGADLLVPIMAELGKAYSWEVKP